MNPVISERVKRSLADVGVLTSHPAGTTPFPVNTRLEPPCNTQMAEIYHSFEIGCFSYAVSGFFFACEIGRYTSIGEAVQIGRGDHPISWLSTSPAFYVNELFKSGPLFDASPELDGFHPDLKDGAPLPYVKPVKIGHDVWIGHAAFIKPGVTIGTGAIVAACSIVTKDVPSYAIVAGNPAKVIRHRFPEELRTRLLACEWWTLAPWQLQDIDISRPESSIDLLERRVAGEKAFRPGFVDYRALIESDVS